MQDIEIPSLGGENILLELNGKSSEIKPYLSLADIEFVADKLGNKAEVDYLRNVAEIIASHTRGTFSADEILQIGKETIERYIQICVNTDKVLQEKYNETAAEDTSERFVLAVEKCMRLYAKNISDSFEKVLLPSIKPIAESTQDIIKNITKSMEPIVEVSESIQAMMSSIQDIWSDRMNSLISVLNHMPDYSRIFDGISAAVRELLKNISIPTITEEEKQHWIDSYTLWGKYGWTLPPMGEVGIFNDPPCDKNEANRIIRSCTSDSEMIELFKELKEMKHIRKSDIEEAIDCFNGKHYKSCVMIIFSLIDARLIRSQIDSDRKRNGQRPSGKTAAFNLFGRIEAQYIDQSMLFTVLNQVNILAALETVFEVGGDFKNQPSVINRNFLDHGMLHRNVTKRDCVMMFLLLYNFTQHLNIVETMD